jgi:hypothetical protein
LWNSSGLYVAVRNPKELKFGETVIIGEKAIRDIRGFGNVGFEALEDYFDLTTDEAETIFDPYEYEIEEDELD